MRFSRRGAGAAIAMIVTMAPAVAGPLSPALEGWWLDGTRRAGIHFEVCGGDGEKLCGSIRWLLHPLTAAGTPETDQLNKNPALRGRRVCGMTLLGDFTADAPDHWSGGWIYNPDDGETYLSTIALAADGTLHVRGYVGIPLLGKSEIWTRPAKTLRPCL